MQQNKFIQDLVEDLSPDRNWRPEWRALTWWLVALLANASVMAWVQLYRPHFLTDLLTYPRFSLEILSAFILGSFLIYRSFIALIPGANAPTWVNRIGVLSAFLFIATLVVSFKDASPPASTTGARAYCVEEVFIYGLVSVISLIYFIRKTNFKVSLDKFWIMGLAAGLIPATLMQMACMYGPMHSLLLHYGPILLVSLIALSLRLFKRA